MDKNISATIVIVVLLVFLVLMAVSWRARKKRQAALDIVIPVPADLGAELGTADGLYLATTPAGDRLNRIAVAGLGFRARLTVVVTDAGVVLPIPGSRDVFIAASAISDIHTASWTIDRGIEPGGLTVIAWTLGDQAVESYFRFDEPTDFTKTARRFVVTGSDTQ